MKTAEALPTRILVVDDKTAEALESVLKVTSQLYRVTTARSGPEALRSLEQQPVDIALVDLILTAEMDGAEVTQRIRATFPATRVIVFTGVESSERKKEVLGAGAFMFLGKPVDHNELLAAIESINAIRRKEIYGEKFQALTDIAYKLQETRVFNEIADRAVKGATSLGFRRARLYLMDDARRTLVGKASCGMEIPFAGYEIPFEAQPIIKGLFDATKPLVWDQSEIRRVYQTDPEPWLSHLGLEDIQWIDCPLVVGNHRIGTIAVDNHGEHDHSGYLVEDLQLLGVLSGLVAHALNNSRLYQHEELAHASLNAILLDSPDAVVTTDLHGIMTRVTPAIERLTGFSAESMRGRKASDFYTDAVGSKEAGRRVALEVMEELSSGRMVSNKVVHVRTPSGKPNLVSLSVNLLHDSAESKIGTVGVLKEVAPPDPRLEHYRNLLEGFGYGTVLLDEHQRIKFLNSKAAHLLQRPEVECEGLEFAEVLPEHSRGDFVQACRDVREQAKPSALKLELMQPSRRLLPVQAELTPHMIKGSAMGVQVALYGTRELMALIQSGRLMVLGEMLANFAHELNNPLALIKGASESISEALPEPSPGLAADLEMLSRNTTRIEDFVHRLKEFARPREFRRSALVVRKLIDDSLALFGMRLREWDVDLVIRIEDGSLAVLGESSRLQQVLVNLITNANDAMDDQSSSKRIEVDCFAEGDEVVMRFGDSGPGVPLAVRESLFEPFVTTKSGGRGTGLGLAISKSVLELHEGSIRLMEEVSSGAWFEIRLPLASGSDADSSDDLGGIS